MRYCDFFTTCIYIYIYICFSFSRILFQVYFIYLQCALVESRLSDHVTVHADQSGNVMGVSVLTLKGSCDQIEMESTSLNYFNTTVSLEMTVSAPV